MIQRTVWPFIGQQHWWYQRFRFVRAKCLSKLTWSSNYCPLITGFKPLIDCAVIAQVMYSASLVPLSVWLSPYLKSVGKPDYCLRDALQTHRRHKRLKWQRVRWASFLWLQLLCKVIVNISIQISLLHQHNYLYSISSFSRHTEQSIVISKS